jgi:glycosyltransferase involved in cell wall biosynthesis
MSARATVIIPTYGNASFARWAIQSVRQQTIKDIEICISCDGSPQETVSLFRDIAKGDSRVRVYQFPKSPRTGEPYRDKIIGETTGQIICYCAHDDLWLPFHIEAVEKTMRKCPFTHSIHTFINVPERIADDQALLGGVHWIDIRNPTIIQNMRTGKNYFGLTYGAHRRDSYFALKEGWTTTPDKDCPTDLYMWQKFLAAFGRQCRTTRKVTALNFQKIHRKNWSEQKRDNELRDYAEKIRNPVFLQKINKLSFLFPPLYPSLFQKIQFHVYSKTQKLARIFRQKET